MKPKTSETAARDLTALCAARRAEREAGRSDMSKIDDKLKRHLLAEGVSARAIDAWDPSMEMDLGPVAAAGAKVYRVNKVIGSSDMEGSEWAEKSFFLPSHMQAYIDDADGEDMVLSINSVCGSVWGGSEICSMINSYPGNVTAVVTGVAASMGSAIAAACDKVVMAPSGTVMLHQASSFAWGNAKLHREVADMLDKMTGAFASYYKKRMDDAVVDAIMESGDDHWFDAEEAVSDEVKFADEIQPMKGEEDSEDDEKGGFGYGFQGGGLRG